jgi:hypothetical protein
LPGQPSSQPADRAAQDTPEFAPRTEHPPRTKLMRPPRPFRSSHTRRPTQHSPPPRSGRAGVRHAPPAPASFQILRGRRASPIHPRRPRSTARLAPALCKRANWTDAGKRTPILQAHDSLPFLRAKRRATVSGINPPSPGFRRNVVAPARRASISTSLPENMMIGVCCR